MKEINWSLICLNCGECCGNVPFPKKQWDRIKSLALRQYEPTPFIGDTILPVTEDLYCVFLTKEKRCLIYEERPKVCRLFGTIQEMPCSYISPNGPKQFSLKHLCNLYMKHLDFFEEQERISNASNKAG